MSYVRAIEGETNSQVLDPAFHRTVQPPSQARELRTTGIPAPPVASINRPQIFAFPAPMNPHATSDLTGQARIGMSGLGQIRRPAPVSELVLSAQIAEQRGAVSTAAKMLGQQMRKRRGMSGLGEQPLLTTTPIPEVKPEIVLQMERAAAQYPSLVEKLVSTGILIGEEAGLFKLLPRQAQIVAIGQARSELAPAGSGITDWFNEQAIAGIPNYALVASGGLLIVLLATKKKR